MTSLPWQRPHDTGTPEPAVNEQDEALPDECCAEFATGSGEHGDECELAEREIPRIGLGFEEDYGFEEDCWPGRSCPSDCLAARPGGTMTTPTPASPPVEPARAGTLAWSPANLRKGDKVARRTQRPGRPWEVGEVVRVIQTRITVRFPLGPVQFAKSGKSIGDLDIYTTYLSEPTPERIAEAEAWQRRGRIVARLRSMDWDRLNDETLVAIEKVLP